MVVPLTPPEKLARKILSKIAKGETAAKRVIGVFGSKPDFERENNGAQKRCRRGHLVAGDNAVLSEHGTLVCRYCSRRAERAQNAEPVEIISKIPRL